MRYNALYLGYNSTYVNQQKNIILSVLKATTNLTMYGPGYNSKKELEMGINSWSNEQQKFEILVLDPGILSHDQNTLSKKYYAEYWSELKKIVPGPIDPADKHKSLADDYFYDSIDQLDFKNDDNQQEDLSDDKIKQEIKALMEETGFVWESVMDYMSDDFVINNAEEKEIYSEIIGEYHSWKKEEDADLHVYTEELINLKIKE